MLKQRRSGSVFHYWCEQCHHRGSAIDQLSEKGAALLIGCRCNSEHASTGCKICGSETHMRRNHWMFG